MWCILEVEGASKMKMTTFKTLAKRLATEHKLQGWELYFGDEFFDTIGACNKTKRAMWFNEFFITRCDRKFCIDTILHEIAHALLPAKVAHKKQWLDKCVEIGAIPLELPCWKNKGFVERFGDMNLPDAPDNVVFPPDDETKIIRI